MIIHFFSHLFWEVSALFNSIPFSFFSPPTYCCLPTNAPFLSIVLAKVNWPYICSSLWLIFNPNFLGIFTTWHCRHSHLGTPLACGFHDADLFPLPLAFFSCFFTPSFPIYLPFPLLVLAPTLPRGARSAFLHQLSLIYIYSGLLNRISVLSPYFLFMQISSVILISWFCSIQIWKAFSKVSKTKLKLSITVIRFQATSLTSHLYSFIC